MKVTPRFCLGRQRCAKERAGAPAWPRGTEVLWDTQVGVSPRPMNRRGKAELERPIGKSLALRLGKTRQMCEQKRQPRTLRECFLH